MTSAHANPAPAAEPSLADRLRGVSVAARDDLGYTRHVFRGEPCYVVRDPVTFQAHRFDPHQYQTLIEIGRHDTLADAFDALVGSGLLERDDEEDFYAFVLDLHRSGLLSLPVGDHKALYTRHTRRRAAELKSKVMSPIFLRIPLWNPDAFFERTAPFVRWAFTRWAFIAWAALMVGAGAVAVLNRDGLAEPLLTALEVETLPMLWVLLIVLKAIHELGHGFACKTFGGAVPEIGVFLIAGTPSAYVDATASWGFARASNRVTVSLAGMYFESVCAALAMFVWASTPPGLINTAAFQTVIMASIVTVGFNINPLAKFDGYYVLCDLTGVPNLRQRASDTLGRWFDRVALGLRGDGPNHGPATTGALLVYAVAASLYRVTLVLGISVMLASKAFVIGVAVAIAYAATTVIGALVKWARYLWFAPKTEPVRRRAVAVSAGLVALFAAAALFLPTPGRATAPGVIALEDERTVRAPGPGTIKPVALRTGAAVRAGDVLAVLTDPEAELALRQAETAVRVAELEHRVAERDGIAGDVAAAGARLGAARAELAEAEQRAARREVRAERSARVLAVDPTAAHAGFVSRGAPLGRLGAGDPLITVYLDERTATEAGLGVGDRVRAHPITAPHRTLAGAVTRIAEAADHAPVPRQLAHTDGGTLMIDPETGASAERLIELTVRLDEPPAGLALGSRVRVVIDTGARTPLVAAVDGLRRLTDRLATR